MLEAVPSDWEGNSLSDGDRLIGEVRIASDGSVSIRFKSAFKWEGEVAWHQYGTWIANGVNRKDDNAELIHCHRPQSIACRERPLLPT